MRGAWQWSDTWLRSAVESCPSGETLDTRVKYRLCQCQLALPTIEELCMTLPPWPCCQVATERTSAQWGRILSDRFIEESLRLPTCTATAPVHCSELWPKMAWPSQRPQAKRPHRQLGALGSVTQCASLPCLVFSLN